MNWDSRLIIFLICIWISGIKAPLPCPDNYCEKVKCTKEVPEGHAGPCKRNQQQTTTICGCCNACANVVGKGGACDPLLSLNQAPPMRVCASGLDCKWDWMSGLSLYKCH
ncbi:hypothetical protein C0J52_18737 [Blattella germanica]|nr:hypothetical protein C0J52_18737 [Blattella germanica]